LRFLGLIAKGAKYPVFRGFSGDFLPFARGCGVLKTPAAVGRKFVENGFDRGWGFPLKKRAEIISAVSIRFNRLFFRD
jgi:hypothetical protein